MPSMPLRAALAASAPSSAKKPRLDSRVPDDAPIDASSPPLPEAASSPSSAEEGGTAAAYVHRKRTSVRPPEPVLNQPEMLVMNHAWGDLSSLKVGSWSERVSVARAIVSQQLASEARSFIHSNRMVLKTWRSAPPVHLAPRHATYPPPHHAPYYFSMMRRNEASSSRCGTRVASIIPALPVWPSFSAYIPIRNSHAVPDQKLLEHVPHFGDDNVEDPLAAVYTKSAVSTKRPKLIRNANCYVLDDWALELLLISNKSTFLSHDETILELKGAFGRNDDCPIEKGSFGSLSNHADAGETFAERIERIGRQANLVQREANPLDIVDSFHVMLCRLCMVFDCPLHGALEKTTPILNRFRSNKAYETLRCEQCPRDCLCGKGQRSDLSMLEQCLIAAEGSLCVTAQLLGAPKSLVLDHLLSRNYDVTIDVSPSSQHSATVFTALSSLNQSEQHRRLSNTDSLKRKMNLLTDEAFLNARLEHECQHEGECTRSKDCSCDKFMHICTLSCSCSIELGFGLRTKWCPLFFPGCRCNGKCSKLCPCVVAGRECNPDLCRRCTQHCGNQLVEFGEPAELLLGKSTLSGWGVFAKRKLAKGTYIGEYLGEIVSQEEAERRGVVTDAKGLSFLFALSSGHCVDANRKGNSIRFVNHADGKKGTPIPNCIVSIFFSAIDSDYHVLMFANRLIDAGEELTFDYRPLAVLEDESLRHQPAKVTWLSSKAKRSAG